MEYRANFIYETNMCTCVCVCVCVCIREWVMPHENQWYRMPKTPRMPYRHTSFSAIRIVISGSLAESDLQLKAFSAFSPPCSYSDMARQFSHWKDAQHASSCRSLSAKELLSAIEPLSAKEPIKIVLVRVIKSQPPPSQGGEDAQNALSCKSLSAKEPIIIVFG